MSIILSRGNLVNGVRRVLVRGGGILNSSMVQRVEYNARGILVRDTKTTRGGYQRAVQKLRAEDIDARHKSSAHKLVARQRSDTQWF
jgi:hypothetical protein